METKSPTNWCNLPPELRTECIERMDFESRMRLRATSSTEKSLVESARKYRFNMIEIDLESVYDRKVVCSEVFVNTLEIEEEDGENSRVFAKKAHQLIFQLLKFAVTDHLKFRTIPIREEGVAEFLSAISACSPLRFTWLALNIPNFEIVKAFLEKCEKPGDIEVEIDGERFSEAQSFELIAIESLKRMRMVRLLNITTFRPSCRMIEKWIEEDVEVGKTLQCNIYDWNCLLDVARSLKDRLISKTRFAIRIRTDNDSKHILIRSALEGHLCSQDTYLSFLVIPADRETSEYGKDDEWAVDVRKAENDRDRRNYYSH